MDVPNVVYSDKYYNYAEQHFSSIWGSSADNVYVTGINSSYLGHGSSHTFPAKYFNGIEWRDWPTQIIDGTDIVNIAPGWYEPSIFWGTSETNLYMATYQSLFHFNGSVWSEINEVESNYITDVWGPSSSDVFVIDLLGNISRYNGLTWEKMESNTQNSLYSVWGTSPTNVYAVGELNTILHYTEDPSSDTPHDTDIDDGTLHYGGGCFIETIIN